MLVCVWPFLMKDFQAFLSLARSLLTFPWCPHPKLLGDFAVVRKFFWEGGSVFHFKGESIRRDLAKQAVNGGFNVKRLNSILVLSFSQFSKAVSGIKITVFQIPDKTSDTIKYLPVILKIHWTSFTYVSSQFYNLSGLKVIRLNEKIQFIPGLINNVQVKNYNSAYDQFFKLNEGNPKCS